MEKLVSHLQAEKSSSPRTNNLTAIKLCEDTLNQLHKALADENNDAETPSKQKENTMESMKKTLCLPKLFHC